MVKFKSTHESNYDIYFKLWQFGWSLCRDLKILEWWIWVTFLFLEECVSLELFIFHQTTRFPKGMEELSKKALLWQLQDFIMTSSCLKGIFCFQWFLKNTPIFWCFLLKKQNHRNLFLCKGNPVPTFVGSKLHVSKWQQSAGVVLSRIRRIYSGDCHHSIWANHWIQPVLFLKENHHTWLIPSSLPFGFIMGKLKFHEKLGFPSLKWNISKTQQKTTNFFHLPRSVLPGPETCMLGLKFTWSDPLGEFTSDFTCTVGFQDSKIPMDFWAQIWETWKDLRRIIHTN